jgi:hypothetical protein
VRTPQWLTMLASHPRVRSFINHPSVRVLLNNPSVKSLVILYIFVCPMLVGALAASDENNPADPKSAFLLAFAINLFYLILVVSIAVFGLNGVARWASKPGSTGDLIVSGDLVRVGRRGGLELG